MFERWLKPVFVFCTQEAAKALIGIVVMAAVPVSFFMGLFSCQRTKAPNENSAVVQAAPTAGSLPAAARPNSLAISDGSKAHPPHPEPVASPSESTTRDRAPATTAPIAAPASEIYCSLTLVIPTRFRDLQILVDGESARITDRQLSLIKLQVPRKSAPVRFTLQSSLLNKPREFTLVVDRDQLEYSPFQ